MNFRDAGFGPAPLHRFRATTWRPQQRSVLVAGRDLQAYTRNVQTTLDIDDDILQAVKELALREGKTAGKMLSDLARSGFNLGKDTALGPGPGGARLENGWLVLPSRGGIVTNEMVAQLLDEADLEDAGIVKHAVEGC